MRTRIEDLPLVRVSTLVANGYIRRDAVTALIRFGDESVEHGIGVRVRRFRNGGFWAMLVCPRCGGGAQRLRLLDDTPACGKCVRASGLRYRVEFATRPPWTLSVWRKAVNAFESAAESMPMILTFLAAWSIGFPSAVNCVGAITIAAGFFETAFSRMEIWPLMSDSDWAPSSGTLTSRS